MQAGYLFARALREDFYGAVGIVANPSGDFEDVGFALYEPTEADALDTAADQEAASFNDRVIG
jgi:hypothetical protein